MFGATSAASVQRGSAVRFESEFAILIISNVDVAVVSVFIMAVKILFWGTYPYSNCVIVIVSFD